MHSLSGYFHISSQLTLEEIKSIPAIEDRLDSHRYFMKLCPSQAEEMVNIEILCYSSVFTFHDDLKQAIITHPDWKPSNPEDPPLFDLFVGELSASGKKSKMLFVSAELSKRDEVTELFWTIYDSTQKSYPNSSMCLFIPIGNITKASPEFCTKIIFNHDKHIGDETLF
jgi:hypothetical protein